MCRSKRIGAIGLRQLGINICQRREVRRDRSRVAAGDGTGQCRLSPLQGVLQSGASEWSDDPLRQAAGRVTDQFLAQQLFSRERSTKGRECVAEQGDDVVAAVCQGRVIERAGILADPERLAADLEHQRLGDGIADLVGRGDTETRTGEPVEILVGAGEGHRRVDRNRRAPRCGERGENTHPVGAGGVGHDGPGAHRPGGGESTDQIRQLGVGNSQQQQFRSVGDVGHRQHRGVGQTPLGQSARDAGHRAAGDDDVLGALQRHTQCAADPPGRHNPDLKAGRPQTIHGAHRFEDLTDFRSGRPSGYRTVGQCIARLSRRGDVARRPATG